MPFGIDITDSDGDGALYEGADPFNIGGGGSGGGSGSSNYNDSSSLPDSGPDYTTDGDSNDGGSSGDGGWEPFGGVGPWGDGVDDGNPTWEYTGINPSDIPGVTDYFGGGGGSGDSGSNNGGGSGSSNDSGGNSGGGFSLPPGLPDPLGLGSGGDGGGGGGGQSPPPTTGSGDSPTPQASSGGVGPTGLTNLLLAQSLSDSSEGSQQSPMAGLSSTQILGGGVALLVLAVVVTGEGA